MDYMALFQSTMNKSLLFLNCLSAIGITITMFNNSGLAQTVVPSGARPDYPNLFPSNTPTPSLPSPPDSPPKSVVNSKVEVLAGFSCQIRKKIVPVLIRSDKSYKSGSNPLPATTGTYQKVGEAYRFRNGTLKNQSILQLQSRYYLVTTAEEARAGSMAPANGAFVCTRTK
jgi:hypothetical protein